MEIALFLYQVPSSQAFQRLPKVTANPQYHVILIYIDELNVLHWHNRQIWCVHAAPSEELHEFNAMQTAFISFILK